MTAGGRAIQHLERLVMHWDAPGRCFRGKEALSGRTAPLLEDAPADAGFSLGGL